LNERLLPEDLEMAGPIECEDNVARSVADHLIGEMNVPIARVPGSRRGHVPFVSQS